MKPSPMTTGRACPLGLSLNRQPRRASCVTLANVVLGDTTQSTARRPSPAAASQKLSKVKSRSTPTSVCNSSCIMKRMRWAEAAASELPASHMTKALLDIGQHVDAVSSCPEPLPSEGAHAKAFALSNSFGSFPGRGTAPTFSGRGTAPAFPGRSTTPPPPPPWKRGLAWEMLPLMTRTLLNKTLLPTLQLNWMGSFANKKS
mmetsp:Transcript_11814/g.33677  ORF Transcript_11814/g.33677 Transcript_11814/m.33677 type:complete len:202 (-) Transcript_11814:1132-1737(-)